MSSASETAGLTARQARERFRGGLAVPTTGWADGFTQANLLSVPRELAYDVLLFAQRNPKPCPLIDVFDAGAVSGKYFDGDIRTDLPGYRIYTDGELTDQVSDVTDLWRDDLVSFLFGCSFTFESALLEAGVPLRHQDAGRNVSMYATRTECEPAGEFAGPLVVSMRPIPAGQVPDAVRVTSRYPSMHGAPVHIGAPELLGIADLSTPDFGDPPVIKDGDLPVFWACGVTPQAAVMRSRPSFAIGHAPGFMAITDARNADFLVP